jgi:hypothetical protein
MGFTSVALVTMPFTFTSLPILSAFTSRIAICFCVFRDLKYTSLQAEKDFVMQLLNLTKVRSNKLLDLMTAHQHRIQAIAVFPNYYFQKLSTQEA